MCVEGGGLGKSTDTASNDASLLWGGAGSVRQLCGGHSFKSIKTKNQNPAHVYNHLKKKFFLSLMENSGGKIPKISIIN